MNTSKRNNILDIAIELVEKAIQKGYIQAWFSWLGWVTVSSFIYVLGSTAHSFVVQALGGVSIAVTLLAGIVGIERLINDWLNANKSHMPRWENMIIVVTMGLIGVYVVFELIGVVFKLTNNGSL